jgi:hypothetical protein
MLSDNIVYNFIEVPMLYNVHFRGTIGPRQYKWYVGAGPLFSYWLGGRGTVINNEYAENDFPPTDYRIRFGERSEDDISGDVYMNDVKRSTDGRFSPIFGLNSATPGWDNRTAQTMSSR